MSKTAQTAEKKSKRQQGANPDLVAVYKSQAKEVKRVFPDEMNLALVTPLLKKSGLSPENLNNYRPLSNLSFLSQLVERVVARQLRSHLETTGLYVPVKSAYRSNHSTETALLKVLNDLQLVADRGDAALLALFD